MLRPSQMQPSLLTYLRHELCAPINGMIGYSELLLEALQTQKESSLFQDVQKIHACSQRLLTLVTTLLDPMQLGKLQIEDLSSFIATRRMELLTPLSAIVGYCELLLEEAPAELIPDLDSLNASAHQLLTSVNDIIHLAQQQLQTLSAISTSESSKELTMAPLVENAIATLDALSLKSFEKQTQGDMILVVDDNPMNCDLLARQLKRQGYVVTIATNAKQALRLLQATPPDLILLDVVMPGINGIELLQQLKRQDTQH